ncbi:MAG: redox-regulated ATPase YchF [DPANN group archaeon]|nr:redox-regulated ATPase YchF [DPANN group archaeon]
MVDLIGIVGKPSSGKSTFFNSLTLADVEMNAHPFTTIRPNEAIGYVSSKCPCTELDVKCNPHNSKCISGTRYIPVKLMDVAGLVPGASEGKGMGNQFLDDLRQASVLIQVVDMSGTTNEKGELSENSNPLDEVEFLEREINLWLYNIINKNWTKLVRSLRMEKREPWESIEIGLSGLGITKKHMQDAVFELDLDIMKGDSWDADTLLSFTKKVRELSKPIIIAANKMDMPKSKDNLEKLKEKYPEKIIIPTSAIIELSLRQAASKYVINYEPGSSSFDVNLDIELLDKQQSGLDIMKRYIEAFKSTGVQECVNRAAYDLLDYIVVYPVENENKYTNTKGDVFPDALLVKKGTTAKQLAFKVHTDIGANFIYAVDCRKHIRIKADQVLEDRDIIRIASAAK